MSTSDDNRKTDKKSVRQTNNPASATPDQGRSAFSAGTTNQGGSNHGQGSSQLGGDAYKQGSEAGKGSNYENEAGKLNTAQPLDDTRKEEGATGHDADKEQDQANKEREDTNNERNPDQVNVERTKETPGQADGTGTEAENPGLH